MNRHERRKAKAGRRSDSSWSFQEGSAYRDRLAAEHGTKAVEAVLVRCGQEPEPPPLVGLVLDTADVAAHLFRSSTGIVGAAHTGVIVGSLALDAAVDFILKTNSTMSESDRADLEAALVDEDHVNVLVVGGGGSVVRRFALPDVEGDDEPGEAVLS